MLAAWSADAQKRVRGQYATSLQPYWRVGNIDRVLSAACQKGQFGQRQYMRFHIGYTGPRGKTITGIATDVWNLNDPLNLRKPNQTYHFFNQGYSDCKVYVSQTPRSAR